jgi:hypothetical protein
MSGQDKAPKLKRWWSVIDNPSAPIVNTSLYSNPTGLSKTAVELVEIPDLTKFLRSVNSMISKQLYSINWLDLQRIKLKNELQSANERIQELEDYINNAGEDT